MQKTTVQIEDLLSKMARLCCEAVEQNQQLADKEVSQLVGSLSTNGWQRHRENLPPLEVVIENRVREIDCAAIGHHPKEIQSKIKQFAKAYEDYIKRSGAYAPSQVSDKNADASQPSKSTLQAE
jgi:iron-sulfur cluster repair protein YtfE (RIC family)